MLLWKPLVRPDVSLFYLEYVLLLLPRLIETPLLTESGLWHSPKRNRSMTSASHPIILSREKFTLLADLLSEFNDVAKTTIFIYHNDVEAVVNISAHFVDTGIHDITITSDSRPIFQYSYFIKGQDISDSLEHGTHIVGNVGGKRAAPAFMAATRCVMALRSNRSKTSHSEQ